MYSVLIKTDDDSKLKKLLANGPIAFSSIPYSYKSENNVSVFDFPNKNDYERVKEVLPKLNINETLKEDNPQTLGQAVAQATANQPNKPRQVQKPKTPQEKAEDDLAADIDSAIDKNPNLKRNMQQAIQRMGIKIGEHVDAYERETIMLARKEGKTWTESIKHAEGFRLKERLIESAIDDITNQLMELFVTLKSQGVKEVPLSKLVKSINSSVIDIDPNQDIDFFIDLLSSLPVVEKVDPSKNTVYLEMPTDPKTIASPKEKEDQKDLVDKVAGSQAKKNISNKKKKSSKQAADNLFASRDYDFDKLVVENSQTLSFEVAEKLADRLAAKGWNGDDSIMDEELERIMNEYPGLDIQTVRSQAVNFFNEYFKD